jgi:hypothetical protein
MWEEKERQRFQLLRQRELEGELTEPDQAELASLTQQLQAAEATYLAPATQRLQQEREALDAQNRSLELLARRKGALVQRLRDFLTEARAERQAIEGELAAVLAGSRNSETDG